MKKKAKTRHKDYMDAIMTKRGQDNVPLLEERLIYSHVHPIFDGRTRISSPPLFRWLTSRLANTDQAPEQAQGYL